MSWSAGDAPLRHLHPRHVEPDVDAARTVAQQHGARIALLFLQLILLLAARIDHDPAARTRLDERAAREGHALQILARDPRLALLRGGGRHGERQPGAQEQCAADPGCRPHPAPPALPIGLAPAAHASERIRRGLACSGSNPVCRKPADSNGCPPARAGSQGGGARPIGAPQAASLAAVVATRAPRWRAPSSSVSLGRRLPSLLAIVVAP